MAIHEPAGRHKRGRGGNITKQQKKQAEAAIYGLEEKTTVPDQHYDPKDIEHMRQLVLQNDIQTGKVLEFDLNKPATETYVHQEFPRIIHNHKSKQMKKVESEKEMQEWLAKGWSKDPPPPPPAEGETPAEGEHQASTEPEETTAEPATEEEAEAPEERHRGGRRR